MAAGAGEGIGTPCGVRGGEPWGWSIPSPSTAVGSGITPSLVWGIPLLAAHPQSNPTNPPQPCRRLASPPAPGAGGLDGGPRPLARARPRPVPGGRGRAEALGRRWAAAPAGSGGRSGFVCRGRAPSPSLPPSPPPGSPPPRRGFAPFSRPLRFLSSSGSYSFPARKQPCLLKKPPWPQRGPGLGTRALSRLKS